MTDYIRGTIWPHMGALTAEDLNDEFDRIAAVLNGGLDSDNFGGALTADLVINAGDPSYQPGGADDAERVENAIADAVANDIKVVWVPRVMWGYAEDASWDPGVFDVTVHVVREGQLHSGHDPVAYGAKPDDPAVDDKPVFDVCYTQAAAAGFSVAENPGAPLVAVTIAGEYQLDSDVTADEDVAYYQVPGVTFAGAGELHSHDTEAHGFTVLDDLVHYEFEIEKVETVSSATVEDFPIQIFGSEPEAALPAQDIDTWYPAYVKLEAEVDGAGFDTLRTYGFATNFDDGSSFDHAYIPLEAGDLNISPVGFRGDDQEDGTETLEFFVRAQNSTGGDRDVRARLTVVMARKSRL